MIESRLWKSLELLTRPKNLYLCLVGPKESATKEAELTEMRIFHSTFQNATEIRNSLSLHWGY